jgi:beta-N-acetylhexosaminidase
MRRHLTRTLATGLALAGLAACATGPGRPGAGVTAGAGGAHPPAPAALRMPAQPPPDACVTGTVRGLGLREQAGQLLLVGIAADGPQLAADVVARERVAGVFLRGTTGRSPAALRARVAALEAAAPDDGPGLFVAVDQEGGAVRTLREPGFAAVPAADEQAALPVGEVGSVTARWAAELAAAGVNLDLAPVADTVPAGRERANPPIGRHGRHYGTEPADVAARVAAVSRELRAHGVLPTVKHFPGLGRVRVNTDTHRGAVDRTADAADPHLVPFTAGVRAGAGAVMVSSATYPRLDPRHPAVFSPAVLQGLLRTTLGWDGLVMTDDVGVAEAVRHVPVWRRPVDFVAAGGDLVLTVRAEFAAPMLAALVLRAERDPAFRARVTESATRVLTVKRSLGLLRCPVPP